MKAGWYSFELPIYRPHPQASTYTLFSYSSLPPLPFQPDAGFQWLRDQPEKDRSLYEARLPDGSKPNLGGFMRLISGVEKNLPETFTTFIQGADLHRRIRSCTDCYLDPGDQVIRTRGLQPGYLIHFLSDSQWCGHWYLHVNDSGGHFVATSQNPYGFSLAGADFVQPVGGLDLESEEIWYCSDSFADFMLRFWLENEIWFAMKWDHRLLTGIEQAYVEHYANFL